MPIQPRSIKTPAVATAKWSSGVQAGGNDWADGYAHPSRSPFDPNVIDPQAWQDGVSTQTAKDKYAANLASVNQEVVLATVNGPGKSKYTQSGVNKTGKVSTFINNFLPKLGQILQNLNSTTPRGPRGTNRGRLNAYLDAVEATRGTNT